ncbi:MAG TPA: M28 family peptidase [Caldilineaceae bacterium]|nr:M28 family peptidase [Caldilineaceae bacterium]
MQLDWPAIDRWLMGEAWTGSRLPAHLAMLCDTIGPRWSSSPGEAATVAYITAQMAEAGLAAVGTEEYRLDTWMLQSYHAALVEDESPVAILPANRCPTCTVIGPLVDTGYATLREIEEAGSRLAGGIAVLALGYEPFTAPMPLAYRLEALAAAGAAAAIVVDRKEGGRVEYHNVGEWRDLVPDRHPLPTVAVTREEGARLRKLAAQRKHLRLLVNSDFYSAPAHNTTAELPGSRWPDEHLLLGAHHDTVYGSPGGNDNASGTAVLLETARVLAGLQTALGVSPGRTIRFVTFSAEEQNLQGSTAYVARHYGEDGDDAPARRRQLRLAINLDELSTGNLKGVVLAFPHLRCLVQSALDELGDGLKCHVMAQLDSSSDHYPFLHAGLDAAHLWRWRFVGRHADSDFHHEPGDTADKVNVRELKEYVGQLARLLLRLSHIEPAAWPANPLTQAEVQARIATERGQVIRVF